MHVVAVEASQLWNPKHIRFTHAFDSKLQPLCSRMHVLLVKRTAVMQLANQVLVLPHQTGGVVRARRPRDAKLSDALDFRYLQGKGPDKVAGTSDQATH